MLKSQRLATAGSRLFADGRRDSPRISRTARGAALDGRGHRNRRQGLGDHAPGHRQSREPRSGNAHPFVLVVETQQGVRRDLARAVIDASGTWRTPNPLGAGGLLAEGEAEFADRIQYGIPDILGRSRVVYAGKTTLVVGSGHSAANALLDLARLRRDNPATKVDLGQLAARISRAFTAAATPTNCRRAGNWAPMSGKWRRPATSSCKLDSLLSQSVNASGRLIVEGETADGPGRLVRSTASSRRRASAPTCRSRANFASN